MDYPYRSPVKKLTYLFLVVLLLAGALLAVSSRQAAALPADATTALPANATPSVVDGGITYDASVGTRVKMRTPGQIIGMRFYKAPANTGTHVGHLWDDFGNELAQVTFSGETASGWQEAYFATPVDVYAGGVYDTWYYAPNGHYSQDAGYWNTWTQMRDFAVPDIDYSVYTGSGYMGGWYPSNHFPNAGFSADNYYVEPIFVPATMPSCNPSCSWFLPGFTPSGIEDTDTTAYELGLRFSSYKAGYVKGVRFYKGPSNIGTHVGHLWDESGNLLASVTFSSETASGWQEADFASPVFIADRTTYVVSYSDPSGHNSYDHGYFTSSSDSFPFHAEAGAGVYVAAPGSFPTQAYANTSYAVDVVFTDIPESNNVTSVTIDPSFTFTVGNKSSACNGESNFLSGAGSATSVAFGHLAADGNVSGGQALAVAGNSGNGFTVYVRGVQSSNNLRSGSHNWADVTGSFATPDVLGSGERFGLTYHDSTSNTSVTNPSSAYFVALDATNHAVMGSSTSMSGIGCLSYDAQASASTPAASYTATVIYLATPTF